MTRVILEPSRSEAGGQSDSVRPLVIYGAGGHGREVALVADRLRTVRLVGLAADSAADPAMIGRGGWEFLGNLDDVAARDDVGRDPLWVVAVGEPALRVRLVERLRDAFGAVDFAVLRDPHAVIAPDATFGPGSVVFAGSIVSTNVDIGNHVHVNAGCIVSHDCRIEDFVTLSPGVRLNGSVAVGRGAFFGTGAVCVPGVRVGARAVVGAGTVVLADVPDGATVVGVPGAVRGHEPTRRGG